MQEKFEDDPTKDMTESQLMDYYHQRKCKECGEVKSVVDFPVELELIVPGISEYCVKCAIYKIKFQG